MPLSVACRSPPRYQAAQIIVIETAGVDPLLAMGIDDLNGHSPGKADDLSSPGRHQM
jgi:hypothetical protein